MSSLEAGQSSSARSGSGRKNRLSGPGSTGVTEDSVYQYALRVAYLAHLTQPKIIKATQPPVTTPVSDHSKRNSVVGKDPNKSLETVISSHLSAFHDIFKDEKKSTRRIPRELIKILRGRLGDITSGRDKNPIYADVYLQKSLGKFYQELQKPNYRKQFKENTSKIEDVVINYLHIAKAELPADMLAKLQDHVSVFIDILKECLQSKECASSVTPEMIARIEIYQSKMTGPKKAPNSNGGGVEDMKMVKTVQEIFNIPPNQAQKDVNALKKDCNEQAALEDLRNILNHVNRGAAFPARREDFASDEAYNNWKTIESKQITENIAVMIQLNPGLALKESTEVRRTLLSGGERTSLSANPRLTTFTGSMHPETMNDAFRLYEAARSTERTDSAYSPNPSGYPQPPYNPQPIHPYNSPYNPHPQYPYNNQNYSYNPQYPYNNPNNSYNPPYNQHNQYNIPPYYDNQPPQYPFNPQLPSQISETKEAFNPPIESSSQGESFTFIPQNPRSHYKYLMYKCINYELERMLESMSTSVKVLSRSTLDLLNECGLRWRVSPAFRWLQYLDAIKNRYDSPDSDVNFDHIKEGFHLLNDSIKLRPIDTWTISDKRELIEVFSGIHDSLLRDLKEGLSQYYRIKPASLEPIFYLMEVIHANELFKEQYANILSSLYNEHRSCIVEVAIEKYQEKRDQIYAQSANEVHTLISIAQWLQQDTNKLQTKFPQPLINQIDIVHLVVRTQIPLFTVDMENAANEISSKVKMTPDEGIPVEDIFDLYREILILKQIFLENCSSETFTFNIEEWFGPHVRKWLEAMDAKTSEWVYSAVRIDKFKAVSLTDTHSSSVVDLFTSFNQTIDFLKRLNWPNEYQNARYMTSLSRTVSIGLEQYCNVVEEKFKEDMFPPEDMEQASKQSTWYVRAKTHMDKAPFDIKPESCIKVNNIEAAHVQLDNLYTSMDVDYIAQVIKDSSHLQSVPEKVEKARYLYTIKIVQAENLPALDTNGFSDPYCVLTDEKNITLVQTRVIYETLNPRWDEAFDIPIEASDKMRWLGVTVWDRDQVGSDDICGKAYIRLDPSYFDDFLAHDVWLDLDPHGRILLRISMEGEKDDIQFYFGKAFRTLKRAHDDMARTIVDRMSPFLRQCLSRDVINRLLKPNPTPSFGGLFAKPDKSTKVELSDLEMEKAIYPLFDYFDKNLMTLNSYLHPIVFTKVMAKVWKEIESIIEELLVPPLSDRPSEMKQLSDIEADVVIKWLKFLLDYLHADGNGLSKEEILENQKYFLIMQIRYYYDMDTEALKQECLSSQITNTLTPVKKSASMNKSVINSRNLGTIKKRKTQKRKNTINQDNSEIILRILRMRSGVKAFLKERMEERARIQAATSDDAQTHSET